MKKLLTLSISILLTSSLNAQPWMPAANTKQLKFSEVISRYKNSPSITTEDDENPANDILNRKESKDHLFQKWNWYWKQHLDKNGFMVSPLYNINEWQRYTNTHNTIANKKTTTYPSNWTFVGPNTTVGGYAGIGRINVVAFDPVDSNTFYVGAAGGGAWKTIDGGATWNPMYSNLPTLGVADIKINPLNRNTIYVATGDADNWDAYSSGVIKSYDGGATWITTGLSWLPNYYYMARSLIINPLDTNTMILATNGGIFKTYDAGTTWTNVSTGDYKQLLYKPTDTNTVYGSMYNGSSSAQITLSTDGGTTFSTVTSFTDAQRINLAVCPASPSLVAAIVSNNSSGLEGIYTSTNSGASYSAVFINDTTCVNNLLSWDNGLPSTSCSGQGWYDLCIAVNPTNPLQMTIGGVNTYYSAEGGATWQIATSWYSTGGSLATAHADKHCLAYNPLTGALFETCDGGVYKTYGPVTDGWTSLSSGLCVTEFYRNAVANGCNFSIGGAQDNGTKMVATSGSSDLTGGDGMQPLINYGDPNNIFYCSSQNGYVLMTRDGGANYHSITDTLHSSGGWITPYILHPTDTATLLLAYKNVYVSHNNGDSWIANSPVFDSNSYINILKIAPSNPNYIYVEYDDYNVWKSVVYFTTNFGVSWDTISIPFTNFISDIAIDPRNENHIWITVSGYSITDKVYGYNLLTNTWTNEAGSLPNLPIDCIVIDTSTQTRYIGTDAAVYYKDTTSYDWILYNNFLPTVHVTCLNINYTNHEIWAATYGRGMWKSNKDNYPSNTPTVNQSVNKATIYPNPNHGSFTISVTGLFESKNVTVTIFSSEGKSVQQQNLNPDNTGKIKITTNGLPAGFYICEVSDGINTVRDRLVIY